MRQSFECARIHSACEHLSPLVDASNITIPWSFQHAILVQADVWAPLCYAGMHPDEVHAVITIQPEVFHRGRHLSWLTAVSEASKQVCKFLNDIIMRFHFRIVEDMQISFTWTLAHLQQV
jgi:hypothetical protein